MPPVILAAHKDSLSQPTCLLLLTAVEKLKKVKIDIPKWATSVYILISLGMIPWVIYLGYSLHNQHISKNWDITWIGLDIAQISSLLITGLLAKINSIYMIVMASITGTLFITDAWFDILGYRLGTFGSSEAIIMAIFGEIPLAIMSYALAIHGLHRLHTKK
jgi:hypothetical protein